MSKRFTFVIEEELLEAAEEYMYNNRMKSVSEVFRVALKQLLADDYNDMNSMNVDNDMNNENVMNDDKDDNSMNDMNNENDSKDMNNMNNDNSMNNENNMNDDNELPWDDSDPDFEIPAYKNERVNAFKSEKPQEKREFSF